MIQYNTPFLGPDGKTVSREWFLFLSSLDRSVGGTTVVNPVTATDVDTLSALIDANDESAKVPSLIDQVNSIERLFFGMDEPPPDVSKNVKSSNVLIWLSV